jgi:hypothetical protein
VLWFLQYRKNIICGTEPSTLRPWTSIQPSQHQLDIVGSSPSKFDGSEHKVLMGIVSKHRIWLWVLILYQNIESKHVLFRIQKGKPIHGNSSETALNRPKNCPSNHIDFPIAEINCLLHWHLYNICNHLYSFITLYLRTQLCLKLSKISAVSGISAFWSKLI